MQVTIQRKCNKPFPFAKVEWFETMLDKFCKAIRSSPVLWESLIKNSYSITIPAHSYKVEILQNQWRSKSSILRNRSISVLILGIFFNIGNKIHFEENLVEHFPLTI